MTDTGRTVDQTSYRLVCDALRETVHAGPGATKGGGSIRYRASAVLYLLLLDHPIDRRGRCRSCRGPSGMIGLRRRPCRIHLRASDYLLRQPTEALLRLHTPCAWNRMRETLNAAVGDRDADPAGFQFRRRRSRCRCAGVSRLPTAPLAARGLSAMLG